MTVTGKQSAWVTARGRIHGIRTLSYPLTIRYVGFKDKKVLAGADTQFFLQEDFSDLPEFVVESKKTEISPYSGIRAGIFHSFFIYRHHIPFQEKMVDFMLPTDRKMRFKRMEFAKDSDLQILRQVFQCQWT